MSINSEKSLLKSPTCTTVTTIDDAVGISRSQEQVDKKQWYIAIVNNNSARNCGEKLEARIAHQDESSKDYEVYVPSQKVLKVDKDGKRKTVQKMVFPSLVLIHCTDKLRREEIVRLPYIKRFMVNIAGRPNDKGIRPIAIIPDKQIANLKRMLCDGDGEVSFDSTINIPLGAKVRIHSGSLAGLEGNVVESEGGAPYLILQIDFLGYAKMKIAKELIEVI